MLTSSEASVDKSLNATNTTSDQPALTCIGLGTRGRWQLKSTPTPTAQIQQLAKQLQIEPVIAQLLIQRGLTDPKAARSFIQPAWSDLQDPSLLPGCQAAAKHISQAITDKRRIVIYGDYDVDGVTASAILWHTISHLGGLVQTYVPHRLEEGYGLNTQALTSILKQTPNALIVSVDCGITAIEQAQVVRDLGGDLIITDHHHLDPENLPDALGLVHPNLPSTTSTDTETDPTTDNTDSPTPLCGAGVALKLAWQTAREHMQTDKLPQQTKQLMVDLLPFAALGTVADVVPLIGENRLLTCFGLARIKQTPWTGLNALIDVAELRAEKVSAYHVGFVLGPRLNAVGRLGHAAEAVKLLTHANEHEAFAIATQLTQINEQRRRTEKRIFDEAVVQIEQENYDASDQRALVLSAPAPERSTQNPADCDLSTGWHPGVIGIVASRLVEKYHRPAVMLAEDTTPNDAIAKGSARSVQGVSIIQAFDACKQHLIQHGGHEMAAGLKLKTQDIQAFRQALITHINAQLKEEDLTGTVTIDAQTTLAACELRLCQQLESLAPFGASNPAPRFVLRHLKLQRPAQRIGQNGKHLRLMFTDAQDNSVTPRPAVAFGFGDHAETLAGGVVIDAVVELKINEFRGVRRADIHLIDFAIHQNNQQMTWQT